MTPEEMKYFLKGMREAAKLAHSAWNCADTMVNQKEQAWRTGKMIEGVANRYLVEALSPPDEGKER